MSTIESRLQRLEDEQAILQTLYAYGAGLDYGLEEEWMDLWTDDAVNVRPGPTPTRGREELVAYFRGHPHAPESWMKHCICDPRITVEGDRASANTYFVRLEWKASTAQGPEVASFGRYEDELVRCDDGRWRFQERRIENETGGSGHRPGPYRVLSPSPRDGWERATKG